MGAHDAAAASHAPADAPLILVVEDNDDMRNFIAGSLARDFRVAVAKDGEEGLAEARRLLPNLIVSDVMMPRLDGMGMLARMRESEDLRAIPVIMVTARTGQDAVVYGLEQGAIDYVTKPFKFNELKARIDSQLRMTRLQRRLDERESRLAAIGQMTGQIAHDLRSPLTAISLRAESIRRLIPADDDGEVDDDLDSIRSSIQRASSMVGDLVEYLRGEELQLDLVACPLTGLLEELAAEAEERMKAAEIDLIVEVVPEDLRATIDRERMRRVLHNLVQNAQEAMTDFDEPRGNRIWLQAFRDEDAIVIRVADNGPGIPEEIRSTLFQPFATSGKRQGTGLGLAIARNLVAAHGGTLDIEDAPPEGGAAFRILLDRDQSFWEELARDLPAE